MHISRYARAILIGIGILIVASVVIWRSQRVDPDLQQGYDELVKLRSACQMGLTYDDFSSRLVNAKVNVDADLARSSDKGSMVGWAFDSAFKWYQSARDNWLSHPDWVGDWFAKASEAVDRVKLYINVNEDGRMKLFADEMKVQVEDSMDVSGAMATEIANLKTVDDKTRLLAKARKEVLDSLRAQAAIRGDTRSTEADEAAATALVTARERAVRKVESVKDADQIAEEQQEKRGKNAKRRGSSTAKRPRSGPEAVSSRGKVRGIGKSRTGTNA